jgi:hypothetical protein
MSRAQEDCARRGGWTAPQGECQVRGRKGRGNIQTKEVVKSTFIVDRRSLIAMYRITKLNTLTLRLAFV